MTEEQQTILVIKGAISELPAEQAKACLELAERMRQMVKLAGPAGVLALALVGAETQAKSE